MFANGDATVGMGGGTITEGHHVISITIHNVVDSKCAQNETLRVKSTLELYKIRF